MKSDLSFLMLDVMQVRAYAVTVLERAEDEELQCYLLQLVQALRFERSDKSRLAFFLVQRGSYEAGFESQYLMVRSRTVVFLYVLVHGTCVTSE